MIKIKPYTVDDITLCIALRVTNVTDWILPRLELIFRRYEPKPNFLIVDFGSEKKYSSKAEDLCIRNNAIYKYVNDNGQFSPAKARNIAYIESLTELLVFSDIDCLFDYDFFEILFKKANKHKLQINKRRYFSMPVVHLGEVISKKIEYDLKKNPKNSLSIEYDVHNYEFRSKNLEFIAPYSNIFMIHRDFFDLSGGYSEEFRGHGSEDFEFLVRLAILSGQSPIPEDLTKDVYGPLTKSFFEKNNQKYIGFRKLLESAAMISEIEGLRTYHLWHQKPANKGYWTVKNDWKRTRLKAMLVAYQEMQSKVLDVDSLPRVANALCLFRDENHWGYFTPYRVLGYKLVLKNHNSDFAELKNQIISGYYSLILIFNPYMKSHKCFQEILKLARDQSIEVVVIERGGLPNSIYYANEVVYGDEEYKRNLEDVKINVTNEEVNFINEFIRKLRTGEESLEASESYEKTESRYFRKQGRNILIPLQLPDDMAVNYFVGDHMSYAEYLHHLRENIVSFPEITFYVKPHPLTKEELLLNFIGCYSNVIVVSREANIHALIDICDATLTYNSGVGLLSVIHQKPTYCLGNTYYSLHGKFAKSVMSIEGAINRIKNDEAIKYNQQDLVKFLSWLIFHKYSYFGAISKINDLGDRYSHSYSRILVNKFRWASKSILFGDSVEVSFNPFSYAGARLCAVQYNETLSFKYKLMQLMAFIFISRKKYNKLVSNPKMFFNDSNSRIVKKISFLFK